jgi:hypothetical protein
MALTLADAEKRRSHLVAVLHQCEAEDMRRAHDVGTRADDNRALNVITAHREAVEHENAVGRDALRECIGGVLAYLNAERKTGDHSRFTNQLLRHKEKELSALATRLCGRHEAVNRP